MTVHRAVLYIQNTIMVFFYFEIKASSVGSLACDYNILFYLLKKKEKGKKNYNNRTKGKII